MRDQEIYQEVGQILFGASPKDDENIFYCGIVDNSSIENRYWYGEFSSSKNGFFIRGENGRRMYDLVRELHEFFLDNKLGEWNVLFFKVDVNSGRFYTKFELNNGLKDRTLTTYDFKKCFELAEYNRFPD